jgi:hypothetical protein
MKLNRLETHDRFQFFTKQNFSISECCEDMIKQRPFGDYPFYIFAHPRTDDDGVTKRMIWQPRLTKPAAQENSMLFRAYPGSDKIKIIWMIPERHLWNQYKKGNVTENNTIGQSIDDFKNNRRKLEAPEDDDLDEETIRDIYGQIAMKKKPKIITTQDS